MSTRIIGRVLAIALRPARSADMREVSEASATAGGCLAGDHSKSAKRGITLLSAPQWADVVAQLGFELPWHSRRANVLIDAVSLGAYVGQSIRVGDLEIAVNGITYPCEHIEDLHPGLRAALTGDRGGVYGRIVCAGAIRVGDAVAVVGEPRRHKSGV